MYHYIVFDVDGTLIDTEQVCLKALQMLLRSRQGREVSLEDCRFSLGIPSHVVLPMVELEETEDILREWDSYYAGMIGEAGVFSGIVPLLEELKMRGVTLGIITSRSGTEMSCDPNMKPLLHYFGVVITAADTETHKPTPGPMLEYLRRTGASPADTLYVGDTTYDCQCAQSAGVAFALALWGAPTAEGIPAEYLPQVPADILEFAGE